MNHVLTLSDDVKFLGIRLDSSSNWSVHTKCGTDKISRNIGLIRFAFNSIPINVLIKMYDAFIYPYIIYAFPVWDSAPICYVNPILVLQKHSILFQRVLTFLILMFLR